MNAPHDRSPAGAQKQDAPAPVCAPLSEAAGIVQPTIAATEDDDALTVAYMVGYAKGKDGALASSVGTVAWADRRDALRYRWLRDPAHSLPDGGEPFLAEEALDAAIDAALASPAGTAKPTSAAVHLEHCQQGEYAGSCKYGDENCPAQPTSAAPAGVQPVNDDPCRTTRAGLSGPMPRWETHTLQATPPTPASEAVAQDAARIRGDRDAI